MKRRWAIGYESKWTGADGNPFWIITKRFLTESSARNAAIIKDLKVWELTEDVDETRSDFVQARIECLKLLGLELSFGPTVSKRYMIRAVYPDGTIRVSRNRDVDQLTADIGAAAQSGATAITARLEQVGVTTNGDNLGAKVDH